jgi:hypothetical protein
LAISKKSTSLALCKQQQKDCVLDSVPTDFIFPKLIGSETIGLQKVHSKPAYPVSYRDASLIRHRTSQPIPFSRKAQRHTQCYFNLHTFPLVHTIAHIEVCSPTRSERLETIFQLFRLFLLMVGNPSCLVLLCLIFTRRDKVCPQYRVRNFHDTDHLRTPQKLFRPLGYTSGISKQFRLSKNDEDLTQPLVVPPFVMETNNDCLCPLVNPTEARIQDCYKRLCNKKRVTRLLRTAIAFSVFTLFKPRWTFFTSKPGQISPQW